MRCVHSIDDEHRKCSPLVTLSQKRKIKDFHLHTIRTRRTVVLNEHQEQRFCQHWNNIDWKTFTRNWSIVIDQNSVSHQDSYLILIAGWRWIVNLHIFVFVPNILKLWYTEGNKLDSAGSWIQLFYIQISFLQYFFHVYASNNIQIYHRSTEYILWWDVHY